MSKKQIITTLVVILALAVIIGFYFLPKEKPIPQLEFPSAGKYSPNVPPSGEWPLVEGRDGGGNLVYKIRMPLKPWVKNVGGEYINGLSLRIHNLEDEGIYQNIDIALRDKKNSWLLGGLVFYHEPSDFIKYHAHSVVSDVNGYLLTKRYLILTKGAILSMDFDYSPVCYFWRAGEDPEQFNPDILDDCHDYFATYTPIIEKVLSTLEVFYYVDDRGFVLNPAATVKIYKLID